MSDIKSFLKICKTYGYPNPKLLSLADMSGYDIDYLLLDLKNELGEKAVVDFCDNAIVKLGAEEGIRAGLGGPKNDEFCYVKIFPLYYDEDESENSVISKYEWGKSKILTMDWAQGVNEPGTEKYVTIEELIDNTSMGEWSELDEFLDSIKEEVNLKVFENCGFNIFWE